MRRMALYRTSGFVDGVSATVGVARALPAHSVRAIVVRNVEPVRIEERLHLSIARATGKTRGFTCDLRSYMAKLTCCEVASHVW